MDRVSNLLKSSVSILGVRPESGIPFTGSARTRSLFSERDQGWWSERNSIAFGRTLRIQDETVCGRPPQKRVQKNELVFFCFRRDRFARERRSASLRTRRWVEQQRQQQKNQIIYRSRAGRSVRFLSSGKVRSNAIRQFRMDRRLTSSKLD